MNESRMLVIERETRNGTLPDRVLALAAADVELQVVRGPATKLALHRAAADRVPVYFVDNLKAALYTAIRFPQTPYVLDVGDAVAAMLWSQGRLLAGSAAMLVEAVAVRRARGVVIRGQGHASLIRALGARRVVLIPDLPTVPVCEFHARDLGRPVVIGFVGSSVSTRRTRYAGWEVPRLLRLLPHARARLIMTGGGLTELKNEALHFGVSERLDLHEGASPDRIPELFEDVDIALSSQTFNVPGDVRTTGKLVDYLALGKVTVASRVGSAAAILPPECTVTHTEPFYSQKYVERVATRIDQLTRLPRSEWLGLQRHLFELAERQFSRPALSRVWTESLREWGILCPDATDFALDGASDHA